MVPNIQEEEWTKGEDFQLLSGRYPQHNRRPQRITQLLNDLEKKGGEREAGIWMNPALYEHASTANLDNQPPATLYYLGRVKDFPSVLQVYTENLDRERTKHWTVLSERDYNVMDQIYDIEEDTLNRFPESNIDFRVTVATDKGLSILPKATKIYDNT
jgi:hypothetical protein